MDSIKSKFIVNTNTIVDTSDAIFTIAPATTTCVTWNSGFTPPTDAETISAFDYLCSKHIITSAQPNPSDSIRRDYLAKILYKGLYALNISQNAATSETTPFDNAPTPFLDLQPSSTYYANEAKALSYLEYSDGVSVFNRTGKYFKPRNGIHADGW